MTANKGRLTGRWVEKKEAGKGDSLQGLSGKRNVKSKEVENEILPRNPSRSPACLY